MMHRPLHSLLFLAGVFAAMGLLGYFFPREGVAIADGFALEFPSPSSLMGPAADKAQATHALEALNRIDTTFRIEGPGEAMDTARNTDQKQELNLRIQY